MLNVAWLTYSTSMRVQFGRLAYVLILLLSSFWVQAQPVAKPAAQKGFLDLSDWNFERDGITELSGDWEFYWNEHLSNLELNLRPLGDEVLMPVPANWNASGIYPALGFATYRLEILLADRTPLALKFRTVGTAYRLFIDGKKLSEVGQPGQSLVSSTPEYRAKIIDFTPKSRRVEIILQVSNFHHRNAGLWEAINIGKPEDLRDLRSNRMSLDLILYGAIVMMALYNLITWLTRTENQSGLFLGLFCMLISTRILLVDERYLTEFFSGIGWSLSTRIEYFSWMISMPIFLNFVRSLFPAEVSRLVLRVFWAITIVFATLSLLLPITFATELAPPFQIVTLLGMAYGAVSIGLAVWRRKEGSYLFALGALCLYGTAISDIMTVMLTLDVDNSMQIGLFLFVLLQSIQVSLRSSRAFQTVEAQSSELAKTNLELNIQEKLRRAAEGESKALHQQLTQSQRTAGYGIVSKAVSDRLASQTNSTDSNSATSIAIGALNDGALLLRGAELERESLDLVAFLETFFAAETYKALRAEFPLVDLKIELEAAEGEFYGTPLHLRILLYHLLRYSLGTQIHAQQLTITGRSDYVFAGGLFHHQVSDGRYYILAIEDKGQGIHPEDLVEIFDPELRIGGFDKLKKHLKDLAVAWTILEDHGGALDLHSLTESTRLELYFPCGGGK